MSEPDYNVSKTNLAYYMLALGLFLLACCVWLLPQQLFSPLLPQQSQFHGSTISIPDTITRLSQGVALLCCLWAGLALYFGVAGGKASPIKIAQIGLLTIIASYLTMAWTLGGWMVDDAAITFAYSENLMRGNGLVLHPNLAPVEGYSNTLWMVLVALPLLVGIEVDITAKVLCLVLGVGALATSAWLVLQYIGSRFDYRNLLLFTLVAVGAPFIVWSASGLESSIQAFLFLLVLLGAHRGDKGIWLVAVSLSGLVLTRPETPLIVASVAAFWSFHHWRENGFSGMMKLWPIVIIPALATLALLAFRFWYFGDLMPNPYYVKGKGTSFLRVLWGGRYALRWLVYSGALVLMPFVFFWAPRRWSLVAYVAAAIVFGQFGFIAFSGGDWMACFRFVAPALPVLAFLLVYANNNSDSGRESLIRAITILAIPFLALGVIRQLLIFEVNPTTPISRVSELGFGILDVAERMGIGDPKLAHHDAGGISFAAEIELVDLAGLTNRYIARYGAYPRLVSNYILVEEQPDFVFGSNQFLLAAMRSRFYTTKKFKKDYVRLEFPDQPHMSANLGADYLSHMRRELVKPGPGIELVYQEDKLVKVIVTPL
jgi:hypothetical protein